MSILPSSMIIFFISALSSKNLFRTVPLPSQHSKVHHHGQTRFFLKRPETGGAVNSWTWWHCRTTDMFKIQAFAAQYLLRTTAYSSSYFLCSSATSPFFLPVIDRAPSVVMSTSLLHGPLSGASSCWWKWLAGNSLSGLHFHQVPQRWQWNFGCCSSNCSHMSPDNSLIRSAAVFANEDILLNQLFFSGHRCKRLATCDPWETVLRGMTFLLLR